MILVDTSVWILTFRRKDPLDLESVVELGDVVTCLPVVQEVLQGFGDEAAFRVARAAMLAFPRLDEPLPLARVEQAVALYRTARRAGVTVRSSVDCVIAAIGVEHDVEVVHHDRDFDELARVSPLRARRVSAR